MLRLKNNFLTLPQAGVPVKPAGRGLLSWLEPPCPMAQILPLYFLTPSP